MKKNIKEVPKINDLVNDTTKPKNIEGLYARILSVVINLYEKHIPDKVKMSDAEIILIQLLIECISKPQNSGYLFLKSNYPNLVNYVERSRFNRLTTSL